MVDESIQGGIHDLGYARLDTDRAARTGDPEVVYGAGKTPEQVVEILRTLHTAHPERAVLATRLTEQASDAVLAALPDTTVTRPRAVGSEPRVTQRATGSRTASGSADSTASDAGSVSRVASTARSGCVACRVRRISTTCSGVLPAP